MMESNGHVVVDVALAAANHDVGDGNVVIEGGAVISSLSTNQPWLQ